MEDVPGGDGFPFGPEIVYKATNSYVVMEEMLYTVLHLPLLSEAFVYYVQQDFSLISPSCPLFLQAKKEVYLAVTADDWYYF